MELGTTSTTWVTHRTHHALHSYASAEQIVADGKFDAWKCVGLAVLRTWMDKKWLDKN